MFRFIVAPYLRSLSNKSPEVILRRSLKLLDPPAIESLREFIRSRLTGSGGFEDRAGKPDLYYTLFGFFLAEALGMTELMPSIKKFTESEVRYRNPEGVHMHCAAILVSRLNSGSDLRKLMKKRVKHELVSGPGRLSGYNSFLYLLTCYYLDDYRSLIRLGRKFIVVQDYGSLPCPVTAATLVLFKSFRKPADDVRNALLSFYGNGSFRANLSAPVPDLLSTAVSLYALDYSGYDLRSIKPECLTFVDSLFMDGGFGGNVLDPDPDVEYTFYGLLALGSLSA